MMKKFITLFIISFSFSALGQIPNWTETSCNGTEYNMYTELENGNAVILNFGAMWCPVCNTNAPELQTIWENSGEGTMNVMMFNFLFQDETSSATDCDDVTQWETAYTLTHPGFANINTIYSQYDSQYGNGSTPLILMFIPDENNPGASELVYNYTDNLGTITGNISTDLSNLLTTHEFGLFDLEEINTIPKKEVIKIIDFMGRETKFRSNTPLIYIYSDGTRKRVLEIKN